MAPRLTPTLLLATALLALVPTAEAQDPTAACGAPVSVADEAGDVVLFPAAPAPEAVRQAELDLLGTSVAVDGTDVVLTATLGAVPSAEAEAYSFRYWFGFHVKPAGGEPEYMDVRMHGKDDLAGAHLITSNEQGNERIAEVAPAWNGTTATFRFAIALLHEVYGSTAIAIGQPEASTDGPFNQETLMWFPTGIAYQVDDAPNGIGDWVAYEACPAATEPAPVETAATEPTALAASEPASKEVPIEAAGQDVPAWGLLGTLAAVAATAVVVRRR